MVAKTKRDIRGMRRANAITARLLRDLIERARPGVRTSDLNTYALDFIRNVSGEAVFQTQNGFPGAINTSVNDEAVHGVPGERTLREGDLLKIDCGIGLDGYCGDTTATTIVGQPEIISEEKLRVLAAAEEALARGIAAVRVGGHVGDIGYAMENFVRSRHLRVLRPFTGHGIGRRLWEQPLIPAYGREGTGPKIVDGLVFTIEPIVTSGSGHVRTDPDGWTIRTVDQAPVAQFEHTIMATMQGPRVLSVV